MLRGPILVIACLVAAAQPRFLHPEIDTIAQTIDSNVCADGTSFLLFIIMFSHAGDKMERALIRETYPVEEIGALGIRRVFVLGRLSGGQEPNSKFKTITDEEILAEAALEKDVIQFDLVEHTKVLSVKSYLASRWALQRCGGARFVAKADDDTFLEYYSISKFLGSLLPEEDNAILGELYWLPGRPYFMVGGFYVMPTPALQRLVVVARPLKLTHGDDILFTGTLANEVGLRRQDVLGIRPWTRGATCCRADDGRVFTCDRFVFLLDASTWRRQAAEFKTHGKGCYLSDCVKYSPGVRGATGVRCINY